MKAYRSVSGTLRALVVAISVAMIVFGVAETLHTHGPFGPAPQERTLRGADRPAAGTQDCLACRASNERGAAIPPEMAAALPLDGGALESPQDRSAPTISVDLSGPPRGPPFAPFPFS